MIVDVKLDSISLDVNPENYEMIYKTESEDSINRDTILLLLNGLLTFKISRDGTYRSSIIDFFIFKDQIKKLNVTFNINLTKGCLEACTKYLLYSERLEQISRGEFDHEVVTTLKTTPRKSQISAIRFLLEKKVALNSSSVGLGKTLSSLGVYNVLNNQNKVNSCIVFCLNENKDTWRKQLDKHTDYSYKIIGNGTDNVLDDLSRFKENILIIHYDAIVNDLVKSAIINKDFDFVIVDEAHVLQNLKSQRTMAFFEIYEAYDPSYCCFLTGTPVSETPLNAYSLMLLMNKNIIPAKTRFSNHFCNYFMVKRKGSNQRIPVLNKSNPYKNLDQLAFLMKTYSFRKTHKDVEGFPKIISDVKEIEMEPDQKALYDKITDETYRQIAAMPEKTLNLHHIMTKTMRQRQCLNHPIILGEKSSSIKFKVLDQILDEIMQDKSAKVVVWSVFRPSLDLIVHKYKDAYGAVLFAGIGDGLTAEARNTNVKRFTEDKDCRLMAGITSKGTGENWGCASTAIFIDEPWSHRELIQSRGRITRLDSIGGVCCFITLNVANSVDNLVRKLHITKEGVCDDIIGEDQIIIDKAELLKGISGNV